MSNNFEAVTNYNFDKITPFNLEFPYVYDRTCKYQYSDETDTVVFEASYVTCPCIYYIVKGRKFCFSFDINDVIDFCEKNSIELIERDEDFFKTSEVLLKLKKSIRDKYKYDIPAIENWKKVVINRKGKISITESEFIPYQVDIMNSPELFLGFILKYRDYVKDMLNKNVFIPTLTGGLDSRSFVGLYRNDIDKCINKQYYLKAIKPDGKNDEDKGAAEVNVSEVIAKKIGLLGRVEDINSKMYTLSGLFNESSRFLSDPNDPEFIYKYIQHSYSRDNMYSNALVPYMDEEYLQFRQEKNVTRALLAVLLIPDLLHIPLIGSTSDYLKNPDGYIFIKKYLSVMPRVNSILSAWGADTVKDFKKKLNS